VAIYTYEVNHGDNVPRVGAGMNISGDPVTAVEFGSTIEKNEKLRSALMEVSSSVHLEDHLIDVIESALNA